MRGGGGGGGGRKGGSEGGGGGREGCGVLMPPCINNLFAHIFQAQPCQTPMAWPDLELHLASEYLMLQGQEASRKFIHLRSLLSLLLLLLLLLLLNLRLVSTATTAPWLLTVVVLS